MDERLSMAPVVRIFAETIRREARVLAFYAGGSLALGDYRPGRSDLDLAAIIERPLSGQARRALRAVHRSIARQHADAAKLHCAYVPADEIDDVARPHLAWAHSRLFRRPFSGIARAELHQGGITVYGPPPAALIPPVSPADLAEAARVELRGYWLGAVRRRRRWRTDLHVDLGLTTLARAEATIGEGRLLTKSEAIARLPALGVPDHVVAEIARRRNGGTVELSGAERRARAAIVRPLMADGIARLAGQDGQSARRPR